MKKMWLFLVVFSVIYITCAKKEKVVKLEAGSPAFELAQKLKKKIPDLDPEKNKILVKTDKFVVTTGEVIHEIRSKIGERLYQMERATIDYLKRVIEKNAQQITEKKLLIEKAKSSGATFNPGDIDSLLNKQYKDYEGEENFLEFLKLGGLSKEMVISEMQEQLMIDNYVEDYTNERVSINEDEIQDLYYKKVKIDRYATVRHLFVTAEGKNTYEILETKNKMEDILNRIKKGENFIKLIRTYSDSKNVKEKDGLKENLSREGDRATPVQFVKAAFSVPVGEFSDVIRSEIGFHIVKVISRQEDTRSLAEVRGQLEKIIRQKKKFEIYNAYLEELKNEVNYTLYPVNVSDKN